MKIDLNKYLGDLKPEEKEQARTVISIGLTAQEQKDWNQLQQATNKKFGKAVKQVIRECIKLAKQG